MDGWILGMFIRKPCLVKSLRMLSMQDPVRGGHLILPTDRFSSLIPTGSLLENRDQLVLFIIWY